MEFTGTEYRIGPHFAIVGGGKFCKLFLQFLLNERLSGEILRILGVADANQQAEGMLYARGRGIYTTGDYREFFRFENLDTLLELTRDPSLAEAIRKEKPDHIQLVDHFEARFLWDSLHVENVRIKGLKELLAKKNDPGAIFELYDRTVDRLAAILQERNRRSREIELELFEHERTLYQIVQGSTIPTFVINQEHIITHWNKAVEKLTGFKAEEMVGTNRQWMPFYHSARPSMADVILDQIGEDEIRKLYGTQWRKSALIEAAYEAEIFFPKLGEGAKWCFFTAAPIKAPDGKIIGAIETLWDTTEDKKAEEERERHTRELSTLVSIYNALNAPSGIEDRIRSAIHDVTIFLTADSAGIFLKENGGAFHLKYRYGFGPETSGAAGPESVPRRAARAEKFTIYEDLPEDGSDEIASLKDAGLRSLVYVPIKTKENHSFGIIRIASQKPRHFSFQDRHILELIANRIGVAIENAMLQEQYIKSEEKYRSLFNNDPNPIFIIDSNTLTISDTNQRAKDCYGYSRPEMVGTPFLLLGDKDDDEVGAGLRNFSRNHSVLFTKKRHFKKGRIPFYVNISVSWAEYGESEVLIATTTDITETVEKETQLIQAGKMTTLGVMAAGMAHEINQPLNVIQVCADFFLKMIKKGQPIAAEDLKSMATDIVANVERAAGVIKHVRDFARQSEVVRSRVCINDPIRDVFKVLGHQLKVHRIEVVLDLDPDIPFILAEHNRLEQVFINLVNNAIDAMDEKGTGHSVANAEKKLRIRSYPAGGQVAVEVADTGIGMSEEVKNKIFEPFFTTKKIGKGTGLGTSISYGIIKDYDGAIEVESEVGKGTTFTLRFPAAA